MLYLSLFAVRVLKRHSMCYVWEVQSTSRTSRPANKTSRISFIYWKDQERKCDTRSKTGIFWYQWVLCVKPREKLSGSVRKWSVGYGPGNRSQICPLGLFVSTHSAQQPHYLSTTPKLWELAPKKSGVILQRGLKIKIKPHMGTPAREVEGTPGLSSAVPGPPAQ